jgi:cytochrome P450
MSTAETAEDVQKRALLFSMNRHDSGYRIDFVENTQALQSRCPIAWNDTHGGYWYVAGNRDLFTVARRADVLSNDSDIHDERRGYEGTSIPAPPKEQRVTVGGFLEMDPPRQQLYRKALNAYLSPAAVARWEPITDEITRACLDEVIESGRIDFVEDLANLVPAIMTMGLLGFPLADYDVYVEPAHAGIYTSPDDPDIERVRKLSYDMGTRAFQSIAEIKETHNPGLTDALVGVELETGHTPDDLEVIGVVMLLIGGGFDTTTALTAHALEWLSEHPDQRQRLLDDFDTLVDPATEEFLRFYTPAQGDGRTISQDVEMEGVSFKEGERVWLSWAMANRDPEVFENPNEVVLDRTGNRHASFGLGIHRCIGSNVARAVFKTMLRHVLERMPDFTCDPGGAVHYDTTGVINGMKHLPASFTPGKRLGPGLTETIAAMQKVIDDQRIAEPVTRNAHTAEIAP